MFTQQLWTFKIELGIIKERFSFIGGLEMEISKKATALLAVCAIAIGMTACGTSSGSEIVAENENTKLLWAHMLIVCIRHIIRPATMYLIQQNRFFLRRLMGSLPRIG